MVVKYIPSLLHVSLTSLRLSNRAGAILARLTSTSRIGDVSAVVRDPSSATRPRGTRPLCTIPAVVRTPPADNRWQRTQLTGVVDLYGTGPHMDGAVAHMHWVES